MIWSPGPDLEVMGHLGLHGLILKHFESLQGQVWSWQALAPACIDFEACWRSPGPDLEVMSTWLLRVDCQAPCPSIGPDRQLGLLSRRGKTRQGMAWHAMAWHCLVRQGEAQHENGMQGKTKHGKVMEGKARQGNARQCDTSQGKAK